MYFKMFRDLFKSDKKREEKDAVKIESDLLSQLDKFREDTKSLDYLRREIEKANQGKSDEEIMRSLAQTFNSDKKKQAK